MRSDHYWSKRAEWRMYGYIQESDKVADEISKAYARAATYLDEESKKVFETFRRKGGISEAEARRILKDCGNATNYEGLKKAYAKLDDPEIRKQMLAGLRSPAFRARIQRLEELRDSLDRQCREIYGIEVSKAQDHLVTTVDEAYNRTMYDIQRGTGYGFSFAQVSMDTANEILKNDWSGKSYSERVWNNTQRVASLIKDELFVGEMVGKSNHEMSAVIMEKMGVGAMAARRLVRTETCYVANQAEMESYKECDVEKYRFIAVLDLQTSEMCAELDGQTFLVSKQQPGVNCPPMHPNCRSTTIACFDDDNLAELKRRARDPVTGKNVMVPADMTYKDWKKLQEETYGEKQMVAKKKATHNTRTDKIQFERYRGILGDSFPKTLAKFQQMKYNNKDVWDSYKSIVLSKNYLQQRLDYVWRGEKLFIPEHTKFEKVVSIAGTGTDTPIRCIDRLIESYGGNSAEWQKKAGKVISAKYVFDLHWYEKDGIQYEVKLKNRGERRRNEN